MNKKVKHILMAALFLAVIAGWESFASTAVVVGTRVTAIPSVRIKVDTTQITAGSEFYADATSLITIPDNQYYCLLDAEWIDPPSILKVGDTLRMKVYLGALPKEVDHDRYVQIWLFTGQYGAGNVSVAKGTLESAEIKEAGYSLEVTLTVDPITGSYDPPQSAYWTGTLGQARWTPSENTSGIYDLICQRDGVTVKKLTSYTGEEYNFYPYMTKEGSYSFQVRCAVPEKYKNTGSVRASDYIDSAAVTVRKEDVSDGTGQTKDDEEGGSSGRSSGNQNFPNGTGAENVAGWVTDSTGSYFRYPGGEYAKNTWLRLSGGWYRFDEKGRMVTKWFRSPDSGLWYYLDPMTGIMKTGWLSDGGHWYFLKPEDDGTQGSMITGWQRINGEMYYFNQSGIMVTGWYQLDGRWYYFYPQGVRADGKYGLMARNVKIGEFTIGPDGYWIY